MEAKKPHISVMLKEVLDYLQPTEGCTILDGTFGAGGYTRAILNSCNCKVIGTDRDSGVKKFADEIKNEYKNRFDFYNLKFSEIKDKIAKNSLDGIVLDLGISSMQVDDAERGFSFNKEAPLSMTMGKNDISAFTIVNEYEEQNIANIIYNFGEEVKSRQIAKKICDYRKNKQIETTTELANIVKSCFSGNFFKIHPATKTFQALRIFVNNELYEIETILKDSIDLLKSNGKFIVVSFHSLEDRLIKDFFKENSELSLSKINKYKDENVKTIFKSLTKKPVDVSNEEAKTNYRSRSAKLRGVMKC